MTTRDSDPITSPSADPRMITDYVTVEEEPMTRTPTKNSETLKAIEERLNATPEPHEPNFTTGQRAYILRIVKEAMNTRAPSDIGGKSQ